MLRVFNRTNLQNVQAFIDKFGDSALKVMEDTGCSALAIMAQMAVETGWGVNTTIVTDEIGNQIDSKNLFNIKADPSWTGKKGTATVREVQNGKAVFIPQLFRVYDSYTESMEDYLTFIQTNPRYAGAWSVRFDSVNYIQNLAIAGYATDPNYAKVILDVMRYDIEVKDDGTSD